MEVPAWRSATARSVSLPYGAALGSVVMARKSLRLALLEQFKGPKPIRNQALSAPLLTEQHLKLCFLLQVIFKHLAGHRADRGTDLPEDTTHRWLMPRLGVGGAQQAWGWRQPPTRGVGCSRTEMARICLARARNST